MIIAQGYYNSDRSNDGLNISQTILPIQEIKQLISGGFGMTGVLLNTGKLWLNSHQDRFEAALELEDINCIAFGYNFITTYDEKEKLKQHKINLIPTLETSIYTCNNIIQQLDRQTSKQYIFQIG